MTRYYLRDRTYDGEGALWLDLITQLADTTQAQYSKNDPMTKNADCNMQTEAEAVKAEDAIIFVHADTESDVANYDAWIEATAQCLRGEVVFVSRVGQSENQMLVNVARSGGIAHHARYHACFWSLPDLVEGKKPGVRALLESLKTNHPDLRFLQPVPAEHLLALRLLCEALLATHGKASATLNGFAVRAPVEPGDWFEPFGMQPSKSAANELADLIGNAGDLRDSTREFLNAVIEGTVTWMDSRQAVRNLCDGLRSASL